MITILITLMTTLTVVAEDRKKENDEQRAEYGDEKKTEAFPA